MPSRGCPWLYSGLCVELRSFPPATCCRAIPLKGSRLRPVRHDQQFWFALAAFLPDARILSGTGR